MVIFHSYLKLPEGISTMSIDYPYMNHRFSIDYPYMNHRFSIDSQEHEKSQEHGENTKHLEIALSFQCFARSRLQVSRRGGKAFLWVRALAQWAMVLDLGSVRCGKSHRFGRWFLKCWLFPWVVWSEISDSRLAVGRWFWLILGIGICMSFYRLQRSTCRKAPSSVMAISSHGYGVDELSKHQNMEK